MAQDISFAGVYWSDTPETVMKKLIDQNLTQAEYSG
jgi:hypothetical protein